MTTNADIIRAIEAFAPPALQEEYDNTGIQVGDPTAVCRGVMLCVDPTPEAVREAVDNGCSLLVSHHPLLFRGVKRLTGATPVETAVIEALRAGLTVYSCHTALDSAPGGVSATMARMLGLGDCRILESQISRAAQICARVASGMADEVRAGQTGLGVIGSLPAPLSPLNLIKRVKKTFGTPVARTTDPSLYGAILRVALCGGSGGDLIGPAIAAGAQAFITSDLRYHAFTDYGPRIMLIDIGHWEAESCATSILENVIREKFPNFAVITSRTAGNPVHYV